MEFDDQNSVSGHHADKTIDWDKAYDNSGAIPNASEFFPYWQEKAAAFRRSAFRIETDLAYGASERERLDLIWPTTEPKGLVVFVHGGYWMRLSKSDWTHLASGPIAHGYAVALPSYTLAPGARISQMTVQIGAAIERAARSVDGPLFLAGHSAGGHLVTRMVCHDTPLSEPTAGRIAHVVSISGLHDLRPLLRTKMNDILKLDEAEAKAESPALLRPKTAASVTAWVGGGELAEFLAQSQSLVDAWKNNIPAVTYVPDGALNHFTVVAGLEDPSAPLCTHLFWPN